MKRIAALVAAAAAAAAIVVVATANEHDGPPPIVVVVFDALATHMLLAEDGKIDAARYPNFAALAETSTWYPNATVVHDSTIKSVPSILDGRWPYKGQMPDVRGHPNNAFVFFHPRWRVEAAEEATQMCPRRICGPRRRHRVVELLHAGREGRYLRAVAHIGRKPQPAFHFIHTMLPHEPLRYFPSGRTYQPQVDPEPGLDGTESYDNEFLSQQAWQRHLLQLGFTDRLLGRLIARMKRAGIWDDAVVVVTADHGMSFQVKDSPAPRFQIGRLGFRRDVTPANAAEVMSVPLFVKAPGQDDGEVSDTWARAIDIFPTIADLAGVRLKWRVHGRSLVAGERPRPPAIRVVRNEGGSLRLPTATIERGRAAALARQRDLFGTGTDSLFRAGPHPELNGREVASLRELERGRVRVRLRAPGTRRTLDPASRYRPSNVIGWIEGGRKDGRALAVAVNGRIAATGLSFKDMGSTRLNVSVLLPEDAFRPGPNDLQVYEVVDGTSLRPLT